MAWTWQDWIALVAVVAAALWLVRHLRLTGTRKKPTGCGACAECAARMPAEPLVSIDLERKT